MNFTIEQKYKYLLSLLEVQDVDLWEKDAMLTIPREYFQFSSEKDLKDIDNVVQLAMSDWWRQTEGGTKGYVVVRKD